MPISIAGDSETKLEFSDLSGADMRTYEALFAHPIAHNLKWHDVVHLLEKLGRVTEKSNHEHAAQIGRGQHVMRRPHGKGLTGSEVMDLRYFLSANFAVPDRSEEPVSAGFGMAANLLVVIEHHQARIFTVKVRGEDSEKHVIRPYDPHHFLHHLTHKDQPRERGQRAHEDATFYERISQALVNAGSILVIGRGTGKSDAADHLMAYIREHHAETAKKLLTELTVDLSHITEPQLLAMARDAFKTVS